MYKVKVKLTFRELWLWDEQQSFEYESRYMAIKPTRLIKEVSNFMHQLNEEYGMPRNTSCNVYAVCVSSKGAYTDSEDLYGSYNEHKGFIKE